jgi:hypothetical protein
MRRQVPQATTRLLTVSSVAQGRTAPRPLHYRLELVFCVLLALKTVIPRALLFITIAFSTASFVPPDLSTRHSAQRFAFLVILGRHSAQQLAQSQRKKPVVFPVSVLSENIALSRPPASIVQAGSIQTIWD